MRNRYEYWLNFPIFFFGPPLWFAFFCAFIFQTVSDWNNEDDWYSSLHPILTAFFYGFYSIGAGNILYQQRDEAGLYYSLEELEKYKIELELRE